MDWRNAPDESAAESARLNRSGNRYASWPDQTDAETARLARSGNAYAAWSDQTDAETARLGRYENRARFMEGMERSWAKQDAAASALALQRQHANADAYRVQLAREAFNFGDGMDARDIRLNSFSYQSRLSVELSKANAEHQMRARFDAGPQVSAWDGVVRLSPAEAYLAQARGGLLGGYADRWDIQVARSLPDAAVNEVGGLLIGKAFGAVGRTVAPLLRGEQGLLRSELQAEFKWGLQRSIAPSTDVTGGIVRNVGDLDAVWMNSLEVRQSQASISFGKLRNGGYTLDDVSRTFATNPEDPRLIVDAVRMPDGKFTSMDNARIVVLNAQGGGQIQVRVREFDDVLTREEARRFTIAGSQPRIPETWGDAITFRLEKQGNQFMSLYPYGSNQIPKITNAPAGSLWSQYSQLPWRR